MSFAKLDELISKKMPVDYWEDEQLFVAQDIIACFVERDWLDAQANFRDKSDEWKCRFLQSISGSANIFVASKIMVSCLESESEAVVEAAIDCLRNVSEELKISLTEEQIETVRAVNLKGGISGRIAGILLSKLDKNHN
jgi:hypothetical protein